MSPLNVLRFIWNHPLNADRKLAALGRVARWQLASRLLSAPIALPFVEGTVLLASRGMAGATGNWYCGLHEVRDMAFVLHLLRPGDHFLDVGANVGSYTVLAAGAVGANVTSVEPIPRTFSHLWRNIVLNNLSASVSAWQVGLSDHPGTLKFTENLDTVNHVLAEGEAASAIDVSVRTLDDVVGPNIPLLIKIDVEGYERSVLLGASRTLADPHVLALVMETNRSGSRYGVGEDQVIALMVEYGFSAFTYDPFSRQLLDASEAERNTVFVRDRATVDTRLRTSRRYQLVNGSI